MPYDYIPNWNGKYIIAIGIVYTIISAIVIMFTKKIQEQKQENLDFLIPRNDLSKSKIAFWCFIALGIIIRYYFACVEYVHGDVTSFIMPWTKSLVENPITDFYFLNGDPSQINYFHDYTPLYMYVLSLIGNIAKFINADLATTFMLQKVPSIIADTVTAIYIMKLSSHVTKQKYLPYVFGICYFFCPAVIVDSALWGQVDGVTAMFTIMVVYYMAKEKDLLAIFFAVVGMCFKLQFIFVAPAVGMYYLIRWYKVKNSFKESMLGLGYGIVFFIAVNIPFTYKIVANGDILFPFKIYISQVGSYQYYTLNAFNLYGALDLNFIELPNKITHVVTNLLTIVVPCIITVFFAIKKPNIKTVLLMSAYVIMFIFTFSFKMHERYMFVTIAVLFALLAIDFSWHLFAVAFSSAFIVFVNIGIIMISESLTYQYNDPRMVVGGICQVANFLLLTSYALRKLVQKEVTTSNFTTKETL